MINGMKRVVLQTVLGGLFVFFGGFAPTRMWYVWVPSLALGWFLLGDSVSLAYNEGTKYRDEEDSTKEKTE